MQPLSSSTTRHTAQDFVLLALFILLRVMFASVRVRAIHYIIVDLT